MQKIVLKKLEELRKENSKLMDKMYEYEKLGITDKPHLDRNLLRNTAKIDVLLSVLRLYSFEIVTDMDSFIKEQQEGIEYLNNIAKKKRGKKSDNKK
jgi:hypothetical protein